VSINKTEYRGGVILFPIAAALRLATPLEAGTYPVPVIGSAVLVVNDHTLGGYFPVQASVALSPALAIEGEFTWFHDRVCTTDEITLCDSMNDFEVAVGPMFQDNDGEALTSFFAQPKLQVAWQLPDAVNGADFAIGISLDLGWQIRPTAHLYIAVVLGAGVAFGGPPYWHSMIFASGGQAWAGMFNLNLLRLGYVF